MTPGRKLPACAAMLVLFLGLAWTAAAQTPELKKPDKLPIEREPASLPKLATHKVEKKPFRIELILKGVLEPEEVTWIAYHPQPTAPHPQGPLTVVKAAEHGTSVRKGGLLAVFDPRRLDQTIQQLEAEAKLLEANLKLAEVEQPLLEKSAPVELMLAAQTKREADEDLAHFLKTVRPETEKRIDFQVKVAAFYLDYAKQQLRQLEKMYKVNDLTEETEQIILKRQRFLVDYETEYYRLILLDRDYLLKTELPRREKSARDGVIKSTLALEKAQTTLAPTIAQKQQNLLRTRLDLAKNRTNLDMLRADRAALTVTAPIDGLVYHGKFSKGQWETGNVAGKLVANGSIPYDEVFMTIMKPGPVFVRVQVEEKDVYLVKPGLEGKAQMVFNPERKLTASVAKMPNVPESPGKYEALVTLTGGGAGLAPGMACSVKFVPYAQKLAIAVPSKAVFEEDDVHYVHVVDKKGKHQRRRVTAGRANDTHTEILDGLREGEEILLERPDAAGKSGEEK